MTNCSIEQAASQVDPSSDSFQHAVSIEVGGGGYGTVYVFRFPPITGNSPYADTARLRGRMCKHCPAHLEPHASNAECSMIWPDVPNGTVSAVASSRFVNGSYRGSHGNEPYKIYDPASVGSSPNGPTNLDVLISQGSIPCFKVVDSPATTQLAPPNPSTQV